MFLLLFQLNEKMSLKKLKKKWASSPTLVLFILTFLTSTNIFSAFTVSKNFFFPSDLHRFRGRPLIWGIKNVLSGHSSKWPAVHCKPVWGVYLMVCFFSTAPLGSVYSKCARASKCDDGILLRSIMLESVCCCWLFSLLMERKSAPHDNISCKKKT